MIFLFSFVCGLHVPYNFFNGIWSLTNDFFGCIKASSGHTFNNICLIEFAQFVSTKLLQLIAIMVKIVVSLLVIALSGVFAAPAPQEDPSQIQVVRYENNNDDVGKYTYT